jgi:hypothetical protein
VDDFRYVYDDIIAAAVDLAEAKSVAAGVLATAR